MTQSTATPSVSSPAPSAAKTPAKQPSSAKAETTVQSIAKKNRVTGTEFRLQYGGNDKENGITKGQYTDRIYGSEHAVMCAQALYNNNYEPGVLAVRCEVQAIEIVRDIVEGE